MHELPLLLTTNVVLPGAAAKILFNQDYNLQVIRQSFINGGLQSDFTVALGFVSSEITPGDKILIGDLISDSTILNVGLKSLGSQFELILKSYICKRVLIATISNITGSNFPDINYSVVLTGVYRATLNSIKIHPYLSATLKSYTLTNKKPLDKETKQLVVDFKTKIGEYLDLDNDDRTIFSRLTQILSTIPVEMLPDFIASLIKSSEADKMALHLAENIRQRIELVLPLLQKQIDFLKSNKKSIIKIHSMSIPELKSLAEQKQINDEDNILSDIKQKAKMLPSNVKPIIEKEIKRLSRMNPSYPDYSSLLNYIELVVDLPWNKFSQDSLDIDHAQNVLDEDHFGLERVKKRLVEFLAVFQLKATVKKGPVLLLVGPPGVGKTSVGRSLARAMGRKFERISLGGSCDQSDIRGHSRTYINSMPGRIINAIRSANTSNPVIILDEVDKLVKGNHGDPAAALLEVLDTEQNDTFTDHYLNMPYDLSQVIFICTANTTATISSPLLDRMELIDLTGYSYDEKKEIASRHLWPKLLTKHGLSLTNTKLLPDALLYVITQYTKEAGVRGLQRNLSAICRAAAVSRTKMKSAEDNFVVDIQTVNEILGTPLYQNLTTSIDRTGVAIGLAWTPHGGEIMYVETSAMSGKGKITLTGQLGDVLRESAMLAVSWIRSHLTAKAIDDGRLHYHLEGIDIHLHFPEGAIGKDGPSAGVAIVTALVSLFSGVRVSSDIAMTGEITLRGLVLRVGGIKEKVLAAQRAGIKRVIVPKANHSDIHQLPSYVKNEVEFITVSSIEEVLQAAFEFGIPPDWQIKLVHKL